MKYLLIILFSACASLSSAQSTYYRAIYSQQINNSCYEGEHISTLDGGNIMLYQGGDPNATTNCITVIKTNSTGNVEWCTRLNISTGWVGNIVQSKDSTYFFCAATAVVSDVYYFIVKLSPAGNVIFQKYLSPPSGYYVTGIPPRSIAKADGGYFFCTEVAITSINMWWNLVSVDDTGGVIWSELYNGFNKHQVRDMDTCSNGDIIILGSQPINNTIGNIITRITQTGTLVWSREYLPSVPGIPYAINGDASGCFVVASGYQHYTPAVSRTKAVITRFSPSGGILWSVYCGALNGNFTPFDCVIGKDNSITVIGLDSLDAIAMKIDSTGIISWGRGYPGCMGLSVDTTAGGGYSIFGINQPWMEAILITTDQFGAGCNDSSRTIDKTPVTWTYNTINTTASMALTPLNPSMEAFHLSPVPVIECTQVSVAEYEWTSTITAYPNPVNNIITISSSEEIDETIITDVHGRVLLHTYPSAHQTAIDVSTYSSGLYIATVITGTKRSTIKFQKAR